MGKRQAVSDPLAAEALEHAFMHNAAPEGMLRELTERGYVLWTVERLARAMHDSDGWPDLRPGHKGEPHLWADCNAEHRRRYITLAERYLARWMP